MIMALSTSPALMEVCLPTHGIASSTRTVGDSYDNALAETVNGLYKTELIYSQT